MKRAKRALIWCLALMFCLGSLPVTPARAAEEFSFNHGKEELTKYLGNGGDVAIPEGVQVITAEAFKNCTALTGVTFPSTLRSIDRRAFEGCTGLTSVTFPKSAGDIDEEAFLGCTGIREFRLEPGNSVYTEAEGVIFDREDGRERLLLYPGGKVGSYTLPASVEEVSQYAFVAALGLSGIYAPAGSEEFMSIDGVLFRKNHTGSRADYLLAAYPGGRQGGYTMPEPPEGQRYGLGDTAFWGCTGLTAVENSYAAGGNPFKGCTALTRVEVAEGRWSDLCSEDGVMFGCSTDRRGERELNELYVYPGGRQGSYSVPQGLRSIWTSAFWNCDALTGVRLPEGLLEIGDYAFEQCGSLTGVVIPAGVHSLGSAVFRDCKSLSAVIIGEGPKKLGSYTFWGCEQLLGVYLPPTITSIGYYAFYGCPNVTIYGEAGSYAETYAKESGLPFSTGKPKLDDRMSADELTLASSEPRSGAGGVDVSDLVLTFNTNVDPNFNWQTGPIRIVSESGGETALEIGNGEFSRMAGVSGAVVTLSGALAGLPDGDYAVTVPKGLINAAELSSQGEVVFFEGLEGESALRFSVARPVEISFPVKTADGVPDENVTVLWNDGWFQSPANAYNHALAQVAAGMAVAAYSGVTNGGTYNVTAALTAAGFEDIVTTNYTRVATQTDNDFVGFAIGLKWLTVEGKKTPLVAVIVRGTPGSEEWISNFAIGESEFHQGFRLAKEGVMSTLDGYLANRQIDKTQAKFLVTGHSRGAAVGNLVAAELTDSASGNRNVYGYNFATPAVSLSAREQGYENIFNINSGEDFVPRLPLAAWGFRRYGVDLTLPDKSTGAHYDQLRPAMDRVFRSFMGRSHISYNGTAQVDRVMEAVHEKIPAVYDVYHTPLRLQGDERCTPEDYFRNLALLLCDTSAETVSTFGRSFLGEYTKITQFFTVNALNGRVADGHMGVTYISWMLSTDEPKLLFDRIEGGTVRTFKRAEIACPVDVYIRDGSGGVVASVVNEEIAADGLALFVEDGVKTVDLPDGESYTLEIVAREAGAVTYTMEELRAAGGESTPLRTLTIRDIPVAQGDVLRGQIEAGQQLPGERYQLTRNGGEVIGVSADTYVPPAPSPTPAPTQAPTPPPTAAPTAVPTLAEPSGGGKKGGAPIALGIGAVAVLGAAAAGALLLRKKSAAGGKDR